jgi:dihydrofolate reductase
MGMVYFELSVSLDGFVAGPNVTAGNPLGDGGERLHDWMFAGRSEAESRAFEEAVFAPVGAMVMGRRMADFGIGPWGEDPTFHMPVFVVTHTAHDPIVRDGGTTYRFVTDGLDSALDQARAVAGDKDVVIGGGATIVRQCLAAGVIDEIRLHLVPVLLGDGVRLFDDAIKAPTEELALTSVDQADGVAHLRYRVRR